MERNPKAIRNALFSIIREVVKNASAFVRDPQRDFIDVFLFMLHSRLLYRRFSERTGADCAFFASIPCHIIRYLFEKDEAPSVLSTPSFSNLGQKMGQPRSGKNFRTVNKETAEAVLFCLLRFSVSILKQPSSEPN